MFFEWIAYCESFRADKPSQHGLRRNWIMDRTPTPMEALNSFLKNARKRVCIPSVKSSAINRLMDILCGGHSYEKQWQVVCRVCACACTFQLPSLKVMLPFYIDYLGIVKCFTKAKLYVIQKQFLRKKVKVVLKSPVCSNANCQYTYVYFHVAF